MNTTTLRVGQMGTNCYLVMDPKTRDAIIIDPGDDAEYVMDHVQQAGATPVAILATHGHFDHIMAGAALQLAYNIPFLLHPADLFLLERMKETAEHFLGHTHVDPPPTTTPLALGSMTIGSASVEIVSAPGHTPGSVYIYDAAGKQAFVGDTIFAGGAVGRTDFSYAKPLALAASIERILALPPDTALRAGHGEPTVVRYEQKIHKGG